MFFKKLVKKRRISYRALRHNLINGKLPLIIDPEFPISNKLKRLNKVLYRIKLRISKKKIKKALRAKLKRYKLVTTHLKMRRLWLITSLITKSHFQQRAILNLIFKPNTPALQLPPRAISTGRVKKTFKNKALLTLAWRLRYLRSITKFTKHWQYTYTFLKKKKRFRRRSKRLMPITVQRNRLRLRKLYLRNIGWYTKLRLLKKLITKSKFFKLFQQTQKFKKFRKARRRYAIYAIQQRRYRKFKGKIFIRKMKRIRLKSKLYKYAANVKRVKFRLKKRSHMQKQLFFFTTKFAQLLITKFFSRKRRRLKKYVPNSQKIIRTALLKFRKASLVAKLRRRFLRKRQTTRPKQNLLQLRYVKRRRLRFYKKYRAFPAKIVYAVLRTLKTLRHTFCKKHYLYTNYTNLLIKKQSIRSWLFSKSFITKKSFSKSIITHYSQQKRLEKYKKTKKKTKKKTYAFNFWRKKLTVLKNARQIHWKLHSYRTLKKRRYKLFLNKQLKKPSTQLNTLTHYFSIKFRFSNNFWHVFNQLYSRYFSSTLMEKRIYQFPIHILFWNFLNYRQHQKRKISVKIRSWIKKTRRIKRRFWMNTKKTLPKYFFQQTLHINTLVNTIQFDYKTNYFCLLRRVKTLPTPASPIAANNMLKLHDIRYKA